MDSRGIPELFDDVSFDIFIRESEVGPNAMFPPNRFTERDKRISDLIGLWQGKLPDVALGPNPVVANLFYGYSTKLANLLLMSQPVSPNVPEGMLSDVAYDGLVDMTRFGGAILLRVGDEISVQNPGYWYPMQGDGDVFVAPYTSDEAQTSDPDRVQVLVVQDETVTERVLGWDRANFGAQLETRSLGDGKVVIVQRDPRNGIWGTAKYLEMFSVVSEIAKRYSTNSRVLDLYTKPLPVFTQSDIDADARFGVTPDDTATQRRERILEGQLGMVMEETMHINDDLMGFEYAQPQTAGVRDALDQIESLMEVVRDLAGLPNLTGLTLSGEALKQLHVHFYAETSAMQNSLRSGLAELLDQDVVWEHIFDDPEGPFSSTARAAQEQSGPMMEGGMVVPEVPFG